VLHLRPPAPLHLHPSPSSFLICLFSSPWNSPPMVYTSSQPTQDGVLGQIDHCGGCGGSTRAGNSNSHYAFSVAEPRRQLLSWNIPPNIHKNRGEHPSLTAQRQAERQKYGEVEDPQYQCLYLFRDRKPSVRAHLHACVFMVFRQHVLLASPIFAVRTVIGQGDLIYFHHKR
jgi:hypothetical protein